MSDLFKIVVNDSLNFEISNKEAEQLDALATSNESYHILKDNKPYFAKILAQDFYNKTYKVSINNSSYEVKISDDLDTQMAEMGFELTSTKDVGYIEAPMPGLILEIIVREGQAVTTDDPLLILEAMKMENLITSPRDGVIKSVAVKKGDAVDKNHLLIEFE